MVEACGLVHIAEGGEYYSHNEQHTRDAGSD